MKEPDAKTLEKWEKKLNNDIIGICEVLGGKTSGLTRLSCHVGDVHIKYETSGNYEILEFQNSKTNKHHMYTRAVDLEDL